jgi:hypothetical protein
MIVGLEVANMGPVIYHKVGEDGQDVIARLIGFAFSVHATTRILGLRFGTGSATSLLSLR